MIGVHVSPTVFFNVREPNCGNFHTILTPRPGSRGARHQQQLHGGSMGRMAGSECGLTKKKGLIYDRVGSLLRVDQAPLPSPWAMGTFWIISHSRTSIEKDVVDPSEHTGRMHVLVIKQRKEKRFITFVSQKGKRGGTSAAQPNSSWVYCAIGGW